MREKTGAEGNTVALARVGSLAQLENSSHRVKKTEGAGAGRAGWPATGAPAGPRNAGTPRCVPLSLPGPRFPPGGPPPQLRGPSRVAAWALSSSDTAIGGKTCSLSLWGCRGDVLFQVPAAQAPFSELHGALNTRDCFHEARSGCSRAHRGRCSCASWCPRRERKSRDLDGRLKTGSGSEAPS